MIDELVCLRFEREPDGSWGPASTDAGPTGRSADASLCWTQPAFQGGLDRCLSEGTARWEGSWLGAEVSVWATREGEGARVMVGRQEDGEPCCGADGLQEAVDRMPFPVCCKDRVGRVVFCNRAFERFYDCRREAVCGRTVAEAFGFADDREREAELLAWESGREQVFELARISPEGELREIEAQAIPLGSQPPLLLCVQADQSDFKMAFRDLSRAREALDSALDIFLLLSGDGSRVVDVNQRAVELLGFPRSSLLELEPSELFPQIGPTQMRRELDKARDDAEGQALARTLMMRRDGSVFAAEVQFRVVGQRMEQVIVLARDVTRRLRVESELRHANRDLALVGAVNKAVVSAASEGELLRSVCRIFRETGAFAAVYGRSLGDRSQETEASCAEGGVALDEAIDGLGLDEADGLEIVECRSSQARVCLAKPRLARSEEGLPRWVMPAHGSTVYLPMRRGKRVLGAFYLFMGLGAEGVEGRLERLQEVADDVAYGVSTQRQEVARRRAEHLVAQRLRVERAVAQYSSDLLAGGEHAECVATGVRRLMESVGADQAFLYESRDDVLHAGSAERLCEMFTPTAPRRLAIPAQVSLEFDSPALEAMGQEEWRQRLRLDLEPEDRLLAYPLQVGDQCLGVVGYVFLGGTQCDPSTGAMLRFAAQLMSELHERSRADRRLKLLAAAMDSTDEGIFITNATERFDCSPMVLVNDGLCRMSGYTREALLGRTPAMLLADGSSMAIASDDSETKGEPARGKANFRRRDASIYLVEYAVYPILDGDGRVAQRLCIYRDITERQKLESRLAFANKMESVGQLSAGIAHEINTPSQFIGDNLRFLKDAWERIEPLVAEAPAALEQDSPKEGRRLRRIIEGFPGAIDDACEGVERISTIVKAMREFSHPEKRFALSDLNRCITTTVTVARNEWKYVAELDLELEDDLPAVEMMPGDINQVLLNLIVNAAHAIAEKEPDGGLGRIVISTRRSGDCAQVAVADSGGGIPEAVQKSIFDPFFTTKEVGKGTGQGLFMAHSIIEQRHGGRLWFESEVGTGTTFYFEIPLVRKSNDDDADN